MDRKMRELTCICCPMGCRITVEMEGDSVMSVSGNTCGKGDRYARTEVVSPVRTLTGSVICEGSLTGEHMVSCKTDREIPKDRMMEAAGALSSIRVKAPVSIGDVLVRNIAGTGADLIATKRIDA